MRRLYFLLASEPDASDAVSTLKSAGLPEQAIHALGRGGRSPANLPPATPRQKSDLRARLARWFWDGELALFF